MPHDHKETAHPNFAGASRQLLRHTSALNAGHFVNDERPKIAKRTVSVARLAGAIAASQVHGDGRAKVNGITFDSRQVEPGDLFAALRGSDFDGHTFIGDAVKRGAAAILAQQVLTTAVPTILTTDSRAALAQLATAFYADPSSELMLIGLTGTDGKTTTSYLTRHILATAGIQTGLIGTVGIDLGDDSQHHLPHQTTPESNLLQGYLREMVEHGTRAAVIEATSHGLAMHRLDGTRFTIAGVTNITTEHLEFHGTVENYRRAKAILVERVAAAGGVVVLNKDDAGAASMADWAGQAPVVWFSTTDTSADLFADQITLDQHGCGFTLVADGQRLPVRLRLLGGFNVENALCALGVSRAAGVDLAHAAAALAEAPGPPGRVTRIQQGQPFGVVVDFAHTPNSMINVLDLLRGLYPNGRLISVFGSSGERDVLKRPVQGEVAVTRGDIAVVTSDDPRHEDPAKIIREIADGARRAGAVSGESVFEITDRTEAIRHALKLAQPNDCVALLGMGPQSHIVWGSHFQPWNEEAVARAELAALGYDAEDRQLGTN